MANAGELNEIKHYLNWPIYQDINCWNANSSGDFLYLWNLLYGHLFKMCLKYTSGRIVAIIATASVATKNAMTFNLEQTNKSLSYILELI